MPEGDDKPAKYPVMFRAADLSLVTKTDLLQYIGEFSRERARDSLRQIGYAGETIELSSRGGAGFEAWLAWLDREVEAQRDRARRGETLRPAIQPEGVEAHTRERGPAR